MVRRTWTTHQAGTASIEAVIALPILLILLMTAFLLGYYVYIKMVLAWHVNQQSENLAQATVVRTIVHDGIELIDQHDKPPPGLSGKNFRGYTLGVPAGPQPFVVSVACYRLPVKLPRFTFDSPSRISPPPHNSSLITDLRKRMAQAQTLINSGDQLVSDLENVRDDAIFFQQMASALSSPDRRKQAMRMFGGWATESLVKTQCGGDGWIITAKAVVWSEKTRVLH